MLKIIRYIFILSLILFFINCSGLNNTTNKTKRSKPSIYISVSALETYPKQMPGEHIDFFEGYYLVDPEKLIFCQRSGKNLFFDKIEAKGKFGVKSQLPS